ncbi:uncharacterized protein [Hemitrygon akajei]|uniref:uncharacterized protein n=1 Tax=Hemitrygon akajei TaxID=2704970 RepID=UPI003BF97812
MDEGGNLAGKAPKRLLPGGSSREDDRDTGSKVPKQGQIESNVPMECSPAAVEVEQSRPKDRDVGDTDQDPGTSTSEATVYQLGSSLNMELSSPQQGAEPKFTISELLAQGDEYRLYQLTTFYRDRLQQAIEEKVERLGWMLTKEGHFSREENEKVTELTEKGNRAESSRLFLSLVMDKGSQARRAMWESFVMWRTELPKLDKILREIQELGPDPQEYMDIAQGFSELPTQLIDVQQKHKETLRAQTETLRVNTILMREKVKVFQLVDRYAELTVISTVRDLRLVEHELLARGRDHEEWRQKLLRGKLEKIRTDQLGRNNLGDSGVKLVSAVLRNPECKIQKLGLDNVGLTDPGAEDLVSALSTNPSLTELNLSDNKLGDSGVKLVSAALRNPQCKIETLWLERVGLTDSGAEDLASALSTNTSLTELKLSANKLGDLGVKLLSAALRNLESKIQKLELERIGLTDSAAKDLASTLSTNPSLTELNLGANKLGDSGVKLVSSVLINPECKIQTLRLWDVGLTDSGVEDLVSNVNKKTLLMELDLGSNSLTDRSVPALRRLILTLPSLERIALGGNQFSEIGWKELVSLQTRTDGDRVNI